MRERQYQEQFMFAKSQHFVGAPQRHGLIEKKIWEQAISSSSRPIIVSATVGKTALLASWTQAFKEQRLSCHVVAHFAGASPTCPTLETSLARVIYDISSHFGLYSSNSAKVETTKQKPSLDLPELRSKLIEVLTLAGERGDLLVLCDGFDQLPSTSLPMDADSRDRFSWVPAKLPDGVSILWLS